MGAGVIQVSGFHVPNEHMMTRGKNRDRREVDPANATGKNIESIIVKSLRAWLASAVIVVVMRLCARGKVKKHSIECCLLALPTSNLEAPEPQHLTFSIIAIICRGMYGLRGWMLRKHAGNA